jgi:hypothetical protein
MVPIDLTDNQPSANKLVLVGINGRMVAVGNLKPAVIVILVRGTFPRLLDGGQGRAAIPPRVYIGNRLRRPLLGVEDAGIAEVEVHLIKVRVMRPLAETVTGFASDVCVHICAYIPSTEGVQAPVSLNRRDLRVVIIVVIIFRSDKVIINGIAKENAKDLVLFRI